MALFAAPPATPPPRERRPTLVAPLIGWACVAIVVFAMALMLLTPGGSNEQRTLHAINHAFANMPAASVQATLFGTNILDVALALGIVILWCAGRVRRFDAVRLRRRALLACLATLIAYAVCLGLGAVLHRPEPLFAVPLERFGTPESWKFIDVAASGSSFFPSAAAAFAAVAAVIAFSIDRRFGWPYLFLGTYASLEAVGLGERWPSDALGGILVGTVVGTAALVVAPRLRPFFDRIIGGFARWPAPAYSVAFLFLAACSDGFTHLESLARAVLHAAGGG